MSFKTGDARTDFQVKCPYNPAHQMPNSRLLYHITSGCQDKARVQDQFAHCPYNFMHIIAKSNMDNHLRQCEDANDLGNDEMLEMRKVLQQQIKEKPKQQQQQNVKQQEIIPGLIMTEQKQQKKKRIRRQKPKQNEQVQKQFPKFGDDDDDEEETNNNIDNNIDNKVKIGQINDQQNEQMQNLTQEFAKQQLENHSKNLPTSKNEKMNYVDSDDDYVNVEAKRPKGRKQKEKE